VLLVKKLRVGIIGTGGIGRGAHLPAYQRLENVELVAACDKVKAAAERAAQEFGIPRVFTRYRDMLKLEELDAVSICTPNAYHCEQTVEALLAGKHVLVEKPLAVNAQEGEAMVAAARKSGKKLMCSLNNRFRSDAQALKELIEAGSLGDIYFARALATRRRGIPGWGVFTQKRHSGGGPLLDIGVHILDLTLWLMGFPEPHSVLGATYAKIGNRKPAKGGGWHWDPAKFDVEDLAAGFIRFKNGASVVLEASWAANIADGDFKSVLMGTKGGAEFGPLKVYTEYQGYVADVVPSVPRDEGSHYLCIRSFVDSCLKDKPVAIPGEQALITTRILDAIYKSGRLGREVKV